MAEIIRELVVFLAYRNRAPALHVSAEYLKGRIFCAASHDRDFGGQQTKKEALRVKHLSLNHLSAVGRTVRMSAQVIERTLFASVSAA